METCDVLLTYEIKNREAESIALIKRELERRGYSVQIREQYSSFFNVPKPIDAKVVVVPAYYRERAMFYTASHVKCARKIVNLQWEQMLANSKSGSKDALAAIKPWGFDALHISWGEDDRRRLLDVYGVPADHVALTGHIGMDYLRPQLRGYYLSRQEITERFGLPKDKEILLFISSFAITTMHERFFEGASVSEAEKEAMYEHRQTSIESQKIIIDWFDRMLTERSDKVVVYRPHPEESDSSLLKAVKSRHSNFYVINDLSVKQWILISDRIYTWASTSTVEVYFADKTCSILNPLPLPEQMTMKLYEGASVIATYEEFSRTLDATHEKFPIPEENIGYFYMRDATRLSHELVCDAIERVLSDNKYALARPLDNPFSGLINAERIACFVKRAVARSAICSMIREKDLLRGTTLRKNIDDVFYVKNKLKQNHVSDKEFDQMIKRIDAVLKQGETACG